MTEDEAKQKWCPMVRVNMIGGDYRAAFNRGVFVGFRDIEQAGPLVRCAASGCMAWRWIDSAMVEVEGREVLRDDRRGYCGMAGKP